VPHHPPKELTANSADGDVRANRPGERRQGRLCAVDIPCKPREPRGNPTVLTVQELDTRSGRGGWWCRQSRANPSRGLERRFPC